MEEEEIKLKEQVKFREDLRTHYKTLLPKGNKVHGEKVFTESTVLGLMLLARELTIKEILSVMKRIPKDK